MNILCTICARKGSKGLKINIANLNGKPLIIHTLNQAKNKIYKRYSCIYKFKIYPKNCRKKIFMVC